MYSPMRSLCFNDDRKTFTVVLPSQYQIFSCEPFGLVFSRDCEDVSLGFVATYSGYRFIALTGAPSKLDFNSKSVRIFDHQLGKIIFEKKYDSNILTIGLGEDILVCCMHLRVEIWNIKINQMTELFQQTGLNLHVPMDLSRDTKSLMISGSSSKKVSYISGLFGSYKVKEFVADKDDISLMKISDDGNYLATACFCGKVIRIWDANTSNCVAILERNNENDLIQSMDFSPSNDFFVSCSSNGYVRVYDIRKKVQNARTTTASICVANLCQQVFMSRICWLNSMIINLISLDGMHFKLLFNGSSLEKEKNTFLSRE